MPWITNRSTAVPVGRSSQFGEGMRRASASQPPHMLRESALGKSFAAGRDAGGGPRRVQQGSLRLGGRGPGGGYRLSRKPEDISVAEVITAIGEGIDATQCAGNENCQDGERCLTHELWTKLGNEIYDFLNGITLASFIQRDDVHEVIRRQQGEVSLSTLRASETVA